MKKQKKGARADFLIGLFITVLIVYGAVLTKTIMVDGKAGDGSDNIASRYQVVVEASRGDILDRNGVTLVSNKQGNSIEFNAALFPTQSERESRNRIIAALIELCESKNEEWTDNLPIKYDESGRLVFEEGRETDIKSLKAANMLNLNSYATAENCLDALIDMYGLEDYDKATARKIASVQYEMWRTGYSVSNPYTFAQDVSNETVSIIKEKSEFYKGVEATVDTYRQLDDGTIAPHVIGITGVISSEEYDAKTQALQESIESGEYTEDEIETMELNAYSLTDYVGKFGIESAMESYLRGEKGIKTISIDNEGNVTSEFTKNPKQGDTVVLTIDSGLQRVAQNSLQKRILELTQEEGLEAAGAVVVLDVDTGEILASASYPSYDLNEYYDKYNDLLKADGSPLINRVTQSTYEPGSTMKLSTAIAGLEEGAITKDSKFLCTSVFQYYDVPFTCLDAHGNINVVTALEKSCNIFLENTGLSIAASCMSPTGPNGWPTSEPPKQRFPTNSPRLRP